MTDKVSWPVEIRTEHRQIWLETGKGVKLLRDMLVNLKNPDKFRESFILVESIVDEVEANFDKAQQAPIGEGRKPRWVVQVLKRGKGRVKKIKKYLTIADLQNYNDLKTKQTAIRICLIEIQEIRKNLNDGPPPEKG